MTSLYSHNIILVLFLWIIKQVYKKKKYLVTGDWSQFSIWVAPCGNVSTGICGQRRTRSAYTFAQSDRGLARPLTESLDIVEYISGEQMPV